MEMWGDRIRFVGNFNFNLYPDGYFPFIFRPGFTDFKSQAPRGQFLR